MHKSHWIKYLSLFSFVVSLFGLTSHITADDSPAVIAEPTTTSVTNNEPRRNLALAIDAGYTVGPSPDTKLTFNGINTFNGDAINLDFFSAGLDLRYLFGRIPFFTKNVKPNVFCGVKARRSFGDSSDRGMDLDVVAAPGDDTFLEVDREGHVMPYCGTGFLSIKQFVGLSFFAGARIEFLDIKGTANETGEINVFNVFKDEDLVTGATLGLEAEMPIGIGNNLGMASMLYFIFAMDYLPSISITRTSAGNNNLYQFETEDEWGPRIVFGLRVYYPHG